MLSIGTRLGPYEILSALGAGGMGEVYLARDTNLGREVAIKVLLPEVASDPGRMARFEREARTLALLNHPNIGTIYGLEEAGGVRALVLELVKGPTLAARMAQGRIAVEDALAIAAQMAEALQVAHASGIVHRDLKPGNVMFGEHGHVKVMDFGLAMQVSEPGTSPSQVETRQQLTHLGAVLGTPAYMAPEQVVGGRADTRSDIFAFGVVLYEMIAGRHPFLKATQTETMTAIVRDPPMPPGGWRDPRTYAVFDKLLAKEPGSRYQTFTEVRAEVRRLREHLAESTADRLDIARTPSRAGVRAPHTHSDAEPTEAVRPPAGHVMGPARTSDGLPFVSRDRELTWLMSRMASALDGHGQLAFVVGEAGSGKSTLLRELALRGREAHPGLLSAFGVCNAQTGFEDPYLPFSQLLSVLIGNLDDSRTAAVDDINSQRLRAFLGTSGRILLEHGPDLVDVLVPGGRLATLAARELSSQVEWLDALGAMRRARQPQQASTAVDQGKLLQQYTDVLVQLSNERPLLLVIDDLQWVDNASIALLNRLTRQLQGHRIFLVGTYRADEVSAAAHRPLLSKALHEYKRQFGDIWLEVGPRDDDHAREFLDAYIDSYPNRLDEDFRRAFLEASRGHALFTVELFRALVDRGVLDKDAEGRWCCGSLVDVGSFPARIEGVIEERVSRLDDASAQILRMACVEGERFTAQVVARLQAIDEGTAIRRISEELITRHALVEEIGEVRSGSTYLNRYRFRHALFQQYLYQRLTGAERRILHREVLHALEGIHAENLSEVAIALGRHAREARLHELASAYLIVAGDAAVQKFAHSEARALFSDALDSLAKVDQTERVIRLTLDTVVKYTNVSFAAISPDEHLRRLQKAQALGHALAMAGDRDDLLRMARLDFWTGRALHYENKLPEAIGYYERVVRTAEEQSAQELVSMSMAMIGRAMCLQGYFAGAEEKLRYALPLLKDQQNWLEYIWAEGFHGLAMAARGSYAEGLVHATEALEVSRRLKFGTGIAASHILLWGAYLQGGDAAAMLRCAGIVEDIAAKAGDRMYVYLAHGMLSWSHYLLGDLSRARLELERSKTVREQLGGQGLIADWFEALDAEILADARECDQAVIQAERALRVAEASDGVYAKGIAYRALALGLAGARPTEWARVTDNFERSLEMLELGQARLEQGRTYARWSALLTSQGRVQEAAAVDARAVAERDQ